MLSAAARAHRFERLTARGSRAALAVAFALSPLLGTLHDATARHVACPEDGELIDAPAQSAHEHPRAASNGPALFPELPLAPQAPGAGHDHCVIALQLRANVGVAVAQPVIAPAPRVVEPTGLAPLSIPPGSDELYRIAPKASPPA